MTERRRRRRDERELRNNAGSIEKKLTNEAMGGVALGEMDDKQLAKYQADQAKLAFVKKVNSGANRGSQRKAQKQYVQGQKDATKDYYAQQQKSFGSTYDLSTPSSVPSYAPENPFEIKKLSPY